MQIAPRTPTSIEYTLRAMITEKQQAIARCRQMIGCFVLLTHVSADKDAGYSAEKFLRTDKDQHSIENNFGFLKDDQIVNALFLKRIERIGGSWSIPCERN